MNSFEWRKYLDLAEELSQRNEQEYLRSCISRAYYAIYHILSLRAGQNTKREKDTHRALIDTYKKLENDLDLKEGLDHLDEADIRELGNVLENLRNIRNDADYDGNKTFTQKKAKEVCETVRDVFQLLEDDDQ